MICQKFLLNIYSQTRVPLLIAIPGSSFAKKRHNDQFFREQEKINSESKKKSETLIDENKPETFEYNFNRENYVQLTREIEQAKKIIQAKQIQATPADPRDLLPRRKRRVFDRPRHDLDLSQYDSWRVFDRNLIKLQKDELPVVTQILIAPKILRHVFGWGRPSIRNGNRSTYEYDFEDTNLNLFMVYDFKATTSYWGENKQNYDYEVNLQNNVLSDTPSLHPFLFQIRIRLIQTLGAGSASTQALMISGIVISLTSSELTVLNMLISGNLNYGSFRSDCSLQVFKVQKQKNQKSFEEQVVQKFGPFEFYDKFQADYKEIPKPSVFKYDKSFWLDKNQKVDTKKSQNNPYYTKIKPAVKLSDQYKV